MLTLFQILAWCATGALVMGGALRFGPSALRHIVDRRKLVLRVLLVCWLAIPALAILMTDILGLRGVGGATLLLMAICPGMPLVLSSARSARGSSDTALTLLIVLSVTAPVFLPLWAKVLTLAHPLDFVVQPRQVVGAILATVFAPLVVGVAVRLVSTRAADGLARVMDVLAKAGGIVASIVALVEGGPLLLDVPFRTVVAATVITLGALLMGYLAGRPKLEDQRTTSLAAALGNPALALAVVAASYPGFKAGAMLAAYALFRAVLLFPIMRLLRSPAPLRYAAPR